MSRKFIIALLAITLTSALAFIAPRISQAGILGDALIDGIVELTFPGENKSPVRALREYCQKRQGDQMNLETWFSGKCPTPEQEAALEYHDRFLGLGDQAGFADMVRLDFVEMIIGYQNKDYKDQIKDALKSVTEAPQDPKEAIKYALTKPSSSPLETINKGIMAMFLLKPVGSTDYIAYVTRNLANKRIIPQTYAAYTGPGIGFESFTGLLGIWKAFRNVAYMVFIVVFVLYGFMMIFRVKIDPKTVTSFEMALPKLIVTLLLITFSYAIVGFLVDLMYVSLNLIASILGTAGLIKAPVYYNNISAVSGNQGLVLSFLMNLLFSLFASSQIMIVLFGTFPAGWGVISGIISALFGFIFWIFIVIALVFIYGQLFFNLLKAYLSIIISLIFAPLILLQNVLPGRDSFGEWVRGITANLMAFPATFFFLCLSAILMFQPLAYFTDQVGGGGASLNLWHIANLSGSSFEMGGWPIIYPNWAGTGVTSSVAVMAFIGLGLLLMANKYVKMVQDAFKVKPFPYGSGINEAMGMGIKYAGKGVEAYSKYRKNNPAPTPTPTSTGTTGTGTTGGGSGV